jgi:hypothetical protein
VDISTTADNYINAMLCKSSFYSMPNPGPQNAKHPFARLPKFKKTPKKEKRKRYQQSKSNGREK